jgi:hypothetical protein
MPWRRDAPVAVEIRLLSCLQPPSAGWLAFASDGQCMSLRWSSERQRPTFIHTANRSDARREYF